MKVRIHYHHTDCGGVVYYANYLNFLEEARTEYFEKRGVTVTGLMQKGIFFVVARQEIDYLAPSFYGDTLEVSASVERMGAARLEFAHEIKKEDGTLVSRAKTVLVFVDKDLKPAPIPQDLKAKLGPS